MPSPTRIPFISSRDSNEPRRMPWDFTHSLLPAAFASALATLAALAALEVATAIIIIIIIAAATAFATALATALAALAALEVATAAARLAGLALAGLQEAGGTTLALGGFSSLAPLQKAKFGSGALVVDQARLSVGHHGQKKPEGEDGESLGDHFFGVGCEMSGFVEY